MMAPLDHTFRYYEPEESFYSVEVPSLVSLESVTIMTSNPELKTEISG
jgi:hypothetical protein